MNTKTLAPFFAGLALFLVGACSDDLTVAEAVVANYEKFVNEMNACAEDDAECVLAVYQKERVRNKVIAKKLYTNGELNGGAPTEAELASFQALLEPVLKAAEVAKGRIDKATMEKVDAARNAEYTRSSN